MAELTKQDLIEAFSSVFGPNGVAASGLGKVSQVAITGWSEVTGLLSKVATNTLTTAEAGAATLLVLNAMGKQQNGGALSTTIGSTVGAIPGMSGFATQISTAFQDSIKNGKTGLSSDAGSQFVQAQKAGFDSMTNFNQQIIDLGPNIRGVGTSSDSVVNNLSKMGAELRQTEAAQRMARTNGPQPDELTKIAIISRMNSTENIANAEAMAKAKTNALMLAETIDKTAKMTGKSRDVIEAELVARMKEPEVSAKMMSMKEDERAAYIRTQAALNQFGPSVNKLADEMKNLGGPYTDEGIQNMIALGPAGRKLQAAMKEQEAAIKSGDEARIKSAALQMESAQTAVAERQNSAQFKRMAALSQLDPSLSGFGRMQRESYGAPALQATQNAVAPGEKPLTAEQARANQDLAYRREQAGQRQDTGVVDQGKQAGSMILEANNQLGIQTSNAAQSLNKLGTEAMRSEGGMKIFSEGMKALNSQWLQPGGGAGPGGYNSSSGKSTGIVKQAAGSKDVFGDWFSKDWGAGGLSELHGEEAVVPKAKLGEFMKDMMSKIKKPGEKGQSADTGALPSMPSADSFASGSNSDPMKDLADGIKQLNIAMTTLVKHSSDIASASKVTADMSGKLTGNRFD